MRRKSSLKLFSLILVLIFSFALLPSGMARAAEIKATEIITESLLPPVETPEEVPQITTNAIEVAPLAVTPTSVAIDYYSINDLHGNVDSSGSASNPGLARLQTYLTNQKAINPNSYFLSSGDQYQGTAISNLTYGDVVNDILDNMDILASAIGNHEFDWGSDEIPRWAREGGFPFVASNIEVAETKKPAEWDTYVKPYYIHTVNVGGTDFKIGFIGIATPETAYKTLAANVEGFTFTDPVVATNKWTTYLKDVAKVDAVISLTHLASYQNSTTKVVTGEIVAYANGVDVDAIFSGHSHQSVSGIVNGIPVVQGLYNARSLSKVSLNFEVTDTAKTLKGVTGSVIDIKALIPSLTQDAAVKKIVDDYYTILSPILNEKVGELTNALPHDTTNMQLTPMGQFVSKVMTEVTGTQIAIVNGGGVRRGFEAGTITMGLMYELLPFDNTLVTLELTGAELKKVIEHGIMPATFRPGQFYGLEVIYNPEAAAGSRIIEIKLADGTPIVDTAVYTVATIDFLLTGGDKYDFSKATNVVDTLIPLREKVAEYIKAEKVITMPFEDMLHVPYVEKIVDVDYFSINDFHGNVDSSGSSKNPGLARIETYLDQMRAINPNTYFLSSGDHFQGTAISNLTHGDVVNESFKEMKLLASAIGNHEFDWGSDLIPMWAKEGGYVYLASNIEVEEDKKPADWDTYVVPYLVQEIVVDGKTIKVGFIGVATPETSFKTAAENVVGFTFTDPIEATNKWSKILVEEEGVDAVIALTHLGAYQSGTDITGEVVNYANAVTNVDAIFTGHTHQVVSGVVNGIPVVQGGYNGRNISNVSLEFTILGPKITLTNVTGKVVNLTALIPSLVEDSAVKAITDKYKTELSPILDEVLGTLENDLPHDTDAMQLTPMGQFIAMCMAELGGTQIAIINGGGIRRGFDKGEITMGLMYELLPFDNTLVTLNISGSELKKLIEHGLMPENFRPGQFYGIEVWYDETKPQGERITTMRLLDGTLIKDDEMYSVSTLDFLLTGGDNYDFSKAVDVVDTNIPVRDYIAEMIREEEVISHTYLEHLHLGAEVIEDDDVVDDDDEVIDDEEEEDTEALPATGTMGDTLYYGIGMMSLFSAGFISIRKKKKSA